jgi:hypothetical protein
MPVFRYSGIPVFSMPKSFFEREPNPKKAEDLQNL